MLAVIIYLEHTRIIHGQLSIENMVIPAISKAQIAETLSKIRNISVQANPPGSASSKPISGFDQVLSAAKSSLNQISTVHSQADAIKESYLKGDTKYSLPQVLISSIQSKVAFEGLVVVRNKLIDAYKEIMNMPV